MFAEITLMISSLRRAPPRTAKSSSMPCEGWRVLRSGGADGGGAAAQAGLKHDMPKSDAQLGPELETNLRNLFGKMDKDNDSILSKAEVRPPLAPTPPSANWAGRERLHTRSTRRATRVPGDRVLGQELR